MTTTTGSTKSGASHVRVPAWGYGAEGTKGEAALNWLALGLLLAAWNVSSDDISKEARPRPASLRGYSFVSVRAASLHAGEPGVIRTD